jgi:hypothetical protein
MDSLKKGVASQVRQGTPANDLTGQEEISRHEPGSSGRQRRNRTTESFIR